jgi:hypothetical protein
MRKSKHVFSQIGQRSRTAHAYHLPQKLMRCPQGGVTLYVREPGLSDTKLKWLRPSEFVGYCTKVQYPCS